MSCFEITAINGFSRTGILHTAHGVVHTPFYMPVATKGAVKNITHPELEEMGFECLISNAFINYFKPGLEVIQHAGGLHKFMGWDHPLFTDSGGFQLVVDGFVHNISDEVVQFRNPFDKSIAKVSPEKAIHIQNALGSDVAMCLDHQPRFGMKRSDYLESQIRTIEWAARCKKAHDENNQKINKKQLLFGITQGGIHADIRVKGAMALTQMGFDGIALGGFGIGEAQKDLFSVLKESKKVIPTEMPVYVMGIGSPVELLEAISCGADMFDSNFPMRMARHGHVFTHAGPIDIAKSVHKNSFIPLDSTCDCFVCKNHSRAYVHHLFKTYEQNGHVLLTRHNVYFISALMKKIRVAIAEQRFSQFKKEFITAYKK